MKKVLAASIIGTLIEWFDFYLYGVIATLVVSEAFFPESDPVAGKLAALSSFAVGFLARPFGAIIFGQLGDRIGRKAVLVITLIMMGIGTTITGLLPTYAAIGVWAPIILVAVRVVQGIGVGGEYGGAVLMILEHGRRTKRRGLLGSIPNACGSAGFLLATGSLAIIAALTTPEQFQEWGWRIPFVASIVLLVVGFYIRRNVEESPVFTELRSANKRARLPIVEVFRTHPRGILVAIAAPGCVAIAYTLVLVYSASYAKDLGIPTGTMLTITTLAQAAYIPLVILWGYLSDHLGRRPPMLFGTIGMAAWIFAFFPLVNTANPTLIFVAIMVSLFFISAMYGPQATFLSELFTAEVRLSGLSFGYQLAFAVAGGLTPITAVALLTATDSWLPICLILVTFAALSSTAIIATRTNHSRRLPHAP